MQWHRAKLLFCCWQRAGDVFWALRWQEYHDKHGHQLPVLRDLKGSFYLRDERDGILRLGLHSKSQCSCVLEFTFF